MISPLKKLKEHCEASQRALQPDAREKIIQASTPLFAQKGLDGVSTRDIAKASKLNISLISYYFGGKEGLYKAVISDFATQARSDLDELLKEVDLDKLDKKNFLAYTRKIIEMMQQVKYKNPHISKLLHREMLSGLVHAREIYQENFTGLIESVVSIFEKAQKNKIMRADVNPYILFLSMTHATEHYYHMNQNCKILRIFEKKCFQLPEENDKYVDQIFKIFIEGVLL